MPVTMLASVDGRSLSLSVRGCLDLSLAPAFWTARRRSQGRYRLLVVDLGRVQRCFDSGLALLLMLRGWARAAGTQLWVVNCSPETRRRCRAIGLDAC